MVHAAYRRLAFLFPFALTALTACGSSNGTLPLTSPSLANDAPQAILTAPSAQGAGAHAFAATQGAASYTSTVLADRPAAFYRLADAGGALVDAGPSHADGSYGSSVARGQGAIVADGAPSARFAGDPYTLNSMALVPRRTALQPAEAITLEAWFSLRAPNTVVNFRTIVSYGRGDSNAWQLKINPHNRLYFTVFASKAPTINGSTYLLPNVPYHVVGTYDGTTAKLYLNGALEGSAAGSGPLNYETAYGPYGLAIGGDQRTDHLQFDGRLADVAIYPAALDAAAVARHYQSGRAGAAPAPTPTPVPSQAPAATSSSYADVVHNDRALAFYRMNDTNAAMADSAGAHNTGSYGRGVAVAKASLTSDGATSGEFFGGANDPSRFAQAPINVAMNPASDVSVEAWIMETARNTTGNYEMVAAYGHGDENVWQLRINPQNSAFFTINSAHSPTVNGKTVLVPGVVYHIVGTYDGTAARLYLNGALDGSAAGSGALDYHRVFSPYGLAIGGNLGSSRPNFQGRISNVAIYGSALSQSSVLHHFETGNIVPKITEVPVLADRFVDSIGIDTHFGFTGTCYEDDYPAFRDLLLASGIRHIRAPLDLKRSDYFAKMAELARGGVHGVMMAPLTMSPSDIKTAFSNLRTSVDAFEGQNEPDVEYPQNWIAPTRTAQAMLWNTVKSDPEMSRFPVYGASIIGSKDYSEIGDLSAYLDAGNMHNYYGSYNPGTPGWGSTTAQFGTYGSLAWQMAVTRQMSGSKGIVTTETGWGTKPGAPQSISYRAAGKYVPRLYLEQYKSGVARTLMYQFCDTPRASTGTFSYFGLVQDDMTPKPSYNALKNMIGLLSDKGANFSPAALTYSISGNTNNVHHLMMKKADGSLWLALWQEVVSWNPNSVNGAAGDYSIPTERVRVAIQNASSLSGSAYTFDANGNRIAGSVSFANGGADIDVSDQVTLVEFTP